MLFKDDMQYGSGGRNPAGRLEALLCGEHGGEFVNYCRLFYLIYPLSSHIL